MSPNYIPTKIMILSEKYTSAISSPPITPNNGKRTTGNNPVTPIPVVPLIQNITITTHIPIVAELFQSSFKLRDKSPIKIAINGPTKRQSSFEDVGIRNLVLLIHNIGGYLYNSNSKILKNVGDAFFMCEFREKLKLGVIQ